MASGRKRDADTGYPQLQAVQINLIIDALLCTIRDRDLGRQLDLAESTAAELTAYYSRRWGLPPAIVARST